jgi:hypothetical protein
LLPVRCPDAGPWGVEAVEHFEWVESTVRSSRPDVQMYVRGALPCLRPVVQCEVAGHSSEDVAGSAVGGLRGVQQAGCVIVCEVGETLYVPHRRCNERPKRDWHPRQPEPGCAHNPDDLGRDSFGSTEVT